jgi:hypothetical protein
MECFFAAIIAATFDFPDVASPIGFNFSRVYLPSQSVQDAVNPFVKSDFYNGPLERFFEPQLIRAFTLLSVRRVH